VLGLNVGADDYITKPFSPAEVQARVRSQLRRYTSLGGLAKSPATLTHRRRRAVTTTSKSVRVDGEPVSLTPMEFAILRLLMERAGAGLLLGRASTSRSGTKTRAAARPPWPCTSGTCARRSRSTPPSRAI
jgi:hypothetical protein